MLRIPFDIYLDELLFIVSCNRVTAVQVDSLQVYGLNYADDVAFVSESEAHLQETLNIAEGHIHGLGLKVNIKNASVWSYA